VCDRVLDGDACSAQPWSQDAADTHTWDLLQMRLLTDINRLRELVGGAIDRVPQFCDARRTRAQAILDDATREESQLVENLAQGTVDQDGYIAAQEHLETRRGDAQALLKEIDGWSFLARLAQVTRRSPSTIAPEVRQLWDQWAREQVPAGRATIVLPLALVLTRLDMSERRRLLDAATERVELLHGEAPVRVVFRNGAAAFAGLGRAMAQTLAAGGARVAVGADGLPPLPP
jgi:hypothetical protein